MVLGQQTLMQHKITGESLQASRRCDHPVQLDIRRAVTLFCSSSGMVWQVLIPCPHYFGLSCSLSLPTPTPRLPFLLCQHSCLSVKPAWEPNQLKNNCAFVVPLGQLFLGQICFLNGLPSRNTKYFFLAQVRQGRQGWMIRMVWEALLLKHSLGRIKQLFDGLCSCGYTISSAQVQSFGTPLWRLQYHSRNTLR